jgi:hypothetical protein
MRVVEHGVLAAEPDRVGGVVRCQHLPQVLDYHIRVVISLRKLLLLPSLRIPTDCVTDLDKRSEMIIFWVNFDHF